MTRQTSQYLADLERRAELASLPASQSQDSLLAELSASPAVSKQLDSRRDSSSAATPATTPVVTPITLGEEDADAIAVQVAFSVDPRILAMRKALHIDDYAYGLLIADAITYQVRHLGATGPDDTDWALAQTMVDAFIADLFDKSGLSLDSGDSLDGGSDNA